jgi:hypothetical protein
MPNLRPGGAEAGRKENPASRHPSDDFPDATRIGNVIAVSSWAARGRSFMIIGHVFHDSFGRFPIGDVTLA